MTISSHRTRCPQAVIDLNSIPIYSRSSCLKTASRCQKRPPINTSCPCLANRMCWWAVEPWETTRPRTKTVLGAQRTLSLSKSIWRGTKSTQPATQSHSETQRAWKRHTRTPTACWATCTRLSWICNSSIKVYNNFRSQNCIIPSTHRSTPNRHSRTVWFSKTVYLSLVNRPSPSISFTRWSSVSSLRNLSSQEEAWMPTKPTLSRPKNSTERKDWWPWHRLSSSKSWLRPRGELWTRSALLRTRWRATRSWAGWPRTPTSTLGSRWLAKSSSASDLSPRVETKSTR